MSVPLQLRAWQHRFVRDLVGHHGDDFLLVACPAAGKTIAAAAGAAAVMDARDCDQLVVACPTVVVRDQWARVLGDLGFRMATGFAGDGWPAHLHGVCATYAQIAMRADTYAQACARRGTVAVFDEIHHAGHQLAWGRGLAAAFTAARLRLLLSGTPFRSDQDRIPFLRYTPEGECVPDFAYDYRRAVRDGVCRPVEFRAHDGVITWRHDNDEERTARLTAPLPASARSRRLRASLDPSQPYLAGLLGSAHQDLRALRRTVPDAGGLVVCDSQAHAFAVDELLAEITGELPVMAMSDLPRAHQAIASFASGHSQWLVSVRMVAEGVDIPRLGVIAWATASSTELMVRQVAGRALRGRGAHADLPAVVHIPADAQLQRYAARLDVLGGVALRDRSPTPDHEAASPTARRGGAGGQEKRVDPAPFVEWFDELAHRVGLRVALDRCGLPYETGARTLRGWRNEGGHVGVLRMWELCHVAGIDFAELYAGDAHSDARAFALDPAERRALDLGTIRALADDGEPATIAPPVPAARITGAPEPVEISTPALPPSPEDLEAAAQGRAELRAELFRLLSLYAQLRRSIDPAYQLATAHRELAAAAGPVPADAHADVLVAAVDWIRGATAATAARHPEHVRQLARSRRRLAVAS